MKKLASLLIVLALALSLAVVPAMAEDYTIRIYSNSTARPYHLVIMCTLNSLFV